MNINRQVKGYIFRTNKGYYYLSWQCGNTEERDEARIYTVDEITDIMLKGRCWGWGNKKYGKWVMVYEKE